MTATTSKPTRAVVLTAEPLLVASTGAARLCAVSTRTWQELTSAGVTPAPVKLARKRLWIVAELRAWTAAGCPTAERWEQIEKQAREQATVRNGRGRSVRPGRIGVRDR